MAALLIGGSTTLATAATAVTPAHRLLVTEIVPDPVGYDNFEFFEVHNTTAAAINLGEAGVEFSYIYENSESRARDVPLTLPAGTVVGAGETLVVWIDYATATVDTSAKTEAEFREHYAATQPATDYSIVRATGQAGLANGGDRGIRISDASGEISRSFYPAGSVAVGRGVHFQVPAAGGATEVLTPLGDPTPGVVLAAALTAPTPPEDPELPTDPGTEPQQVLPRELLVTEFAPDHPGTDRYEYVEVANTTDRDIDLSASGLTIVYDYLTGTKPLGYPQGATVPAHGVALLWLNYSNTAGLTAADFRAYYGLDAGVTVIPITGQDGFANAVERGVSLIANDTVISAARYQGAQVGAGLGVDYRLPTRSTATTMSVLRPLAPPTPGSVAPEAFVPAPFAPQPDPALSTAALQVTELAPDTANVAGADAYEFIEVYNSTSAPLDFGDYTLEYLYPLPDLTNSSTALWPATVRDAVIPAGGTLVFWIKNGANSQLTAADFNQHFGSTLMPGVNLLEINSGGMANGAARGVQVVTNTGHIVNRAYYWLGGVDDTTPDQPIQYAVNREDLTLQTKLGVATATPGTVFAEQVEDGLMVVPADTEAPVIVDQTAAEIPTGSDFPLSFQVSDETQVKTVTLRLRSNLDSDFTATQLIGPNGQFSAQITAVDLTGKRYFEYELIARDGTHEVSTGITRLPVAGASTESLRLNLTDSQWLRGQVPVIVGTDAFPASADLTIDGAPVDTEAQLERAPVFVFEASGVDTFFRNGVRVGDEVLHIFDDGIYSGWETIATEVPLEFITAGETVTVSVWAGTKAAPEINLNENNDDFSIRGLRLILPDGRTLTPADYDDPTRVLAMGDSVGKLDFADATFTVPENAATSLHHLWETTAVSDGEHQVVATDGTTQAQARVVVDNTAPMISTELVDGRRYQGEFTIDAAATDAGSGVTEITATLDGRPLALPTTTSSIKLADGAHEVVFVARDAAGNVSERVVAFTTPVEEPGNELMSPVDGAAFTTDDTIELRARATDPTDDVLAVSLNRGYRLVAGDGITAYTGQTQIAASTVREGARVLTKEEAAQIGRLDEAALTEVSDTALPYQLFEVAVPADAGADSRVRVRWDGAANPGAKVIMSALSTAGDWNELGRAFAAETAALTLEATVPVEGHAAAGKITVLVQHSEGFAGADLSSRASAVTPYHAEATDRAAYDFTLAWESDTQYYNEEFHQHQTAIHDFLLAERANLNLQYLFHTGDIVDDYDQTWQWDFANPEYAKLDAAGLPYGVLAGNHDVGHKEIDYTNFGTYFGAERFSANPWWGGDYNDNRGHYDLITAGGIDFLVLSMGWGPGDAEIEWMNQVLAKFPERVAILNLHEYMLTTGGLGPIPQRIYDEVIATNANVRMVMSGHYHDAFTRVDGFDDDGDGTAERQVYQMLFDYQGLPEGGQGYLRLMHFDNQSGQIVVRTYSPSLADFDSDDPTLEPQHQSFTIPYAAVGVQPQQKQLSTDAFSVDVLTAEPIASFEEVASGAEVAAQWQPGVGSHGWYAASIDPYGASADSEVRLLTVTEPSGTGGGPGDGTGGETGGGTDSPGGGSGHPGAGAPGTPSVAVPVADLDPALQGAITAPDSVRVGDPFTVQLAAQHAGTWVQLWLHSEPTALGGWTQVTPHGMVTGIVPAGTPAGTHTLVAQSASGVLGWTSITVAGSPEKAQIAELGKTGMDDWWTLTVGVATLAALLLGAGALLALRRPRS